MVDETQKEWLREVEARTLNGIPVHQGISVRPVRIDDILKADGEWWKIFFVRKVDGISTSLIKNPLKLPANAILDDCYMWTGEPYEYQPENPCDEEFMLEQDTKGETDEPKSCD